MSHQRDPELLSEHLLGEVHAGPGLIARVRKRVNDLAFDPGPTYRSGSITGLVDNHYEETDASQIFTLYLGTRAWLGLPSNPRLEAEYLRKHRRSDTEALIGKEDEKEAGLLARLKQEARLLLQHPSDAAIDRLLELTRFLTSWMNSVCAHDFEELDVAGDIKVLECGTCNIKVGSFRDRWVAV